MRIFSEAWAQAFQQAINEQGDYAKSGKNWTLGKLALVQDEQAVILDLHEGECRDVMSSTAAIAEEEANFVIIGSSAVWQDVLSGKVQPLMGLMTGKLKLSKGSIGKLMPYTQAAVDLVGSARTVDTTF